MYDKPVQTGVAEASKAITDEPTLVYWIFVQITTLDTLGTLKIRDGFSTSDKEIARITTLHGGMFPFYPPLRCAAGLYVEATSGVTSFTVGYLFERLVSGKE